MMSTLDSAYNGVREKERKNEKWNEGEREKRERERERERVEEWEEYLCDQLFLP
jgi:hypothetical protein